jgi:ribosomal-protein-alanine N-acetyltransferase
MCTSAPALEFRKLTAEWKQPLLGFLRALEEAGDTDYFLPHPFTDEAVENIIHNARNDLYYVLTEGERVLGYGMLRGWDEGYETPSLGIAIDPRARSSGLGKLFMRFLSTAARWKGATSVRLKVKVGNSRAANLYEQLGYDFRTEESGYLIGTLELGPRRFETRTGV